MTKSDFETSIVNGFHTILREVQLIEVSDAVVILMGMLLDVCFFIIDYLNFRMESLLPFKEVTCWRKCLTEKVPGLDKSGDSLMIL